MSDELFITWNKDDPASKQKAFAKAGEAIQKARPITKSAWNHTWKNILPNTSVRDEFTRRDYEFFRPSETVPTKSKEIIRACMKAYKSIGIIKNIIDLMAEYACQGVRLVHPTKRYEKFYQSWAEKVNFKERSERFLNNLYRTGNVIVYRGTARAKVTDVEDLHKGRAAPEKEIPKPLRLERMEIPWTYTFLNPLLIDVEEEAIAQFIGPEGYTFLWNVPAQLLKKPTAGFKQKNANLLGKIPEHFRRYIDAGEKRIPIDNDKLSVFYYKKDDWEVWADPMVHAIMDDLITLEKMRLADLAALDGAISHIRLWKLGSLEYQLLPQPAAVDKLTEILLNNVGGGTMDLIWGPELELIETSTDIYKFLGSEKYAFTLSAIYAGLGIPPSLTGSGSGGSGFSNNYISLRTLIERLCYGRDILVSFWKRELKLIQQSMGHAKPAQIVFDHMNLSDEAAEKNLWIQLADRDYISLEAIQRRFGEIPEIEQMRMKREARMRKAGKLPPKGNAFHNEANFDGEAKKILLQKGLITPEEAGIDLEDRPAGKNPPIVDERKHQLKVGSQNAEKVSESGNPQGGRPKNKKDSIKRKKKRVLPRSAASLANTILWAKFAQTKIAEIINPAFLRSKSKKTMRELTDREFKTAEDYKFALLCQIKPGIELNDSSLQKLSPRIPKLLKEAVAKSLGKFAERFGREATIDELRHMQVTAYAFYLEAGDGVQSLEK